MKITPNTSLLAALSQLAGAERSAPTEPVGQARRAGDEQDPRRAEIIAEFKARRRPSSPAELDAARKRATEAGDQFRREVPGAVTDRAGATRDIPPGQIIDILV